MKVILSNTKIFYDADDFTKREVMIYALDMKKRLCKSDSVRIVVHSLKFFRLKDGSVGANFKIEYKGDYQYPRYGEGWLNGFVKNWNVFYNPPKNLLSC